MAEKSGKDLVDKDGEMDLSVEKSDLDNPEGPLAPAGEAKDHPTLDAPDAPKSVTGNATPNKKG